MKRADYVEAVTEFHRAFMVPVREVGHGEAIPEIENTLRVNLIEEEANETTKAIVKVDRVEVADGLADTIYVLAGTTAQLGLPNIELSRVYRFMISQSSARVIAALQYFAHEEISEELMALEVQSFIQILEKVAMEMNIPIGLVFKEVHRSNMSKLHEDGKPRYRGSDGKVLKPESYSPADIESLLEHYKSFYVEDVA